MKLSKNVNNKKCAPKLILFNEKKIGKIRIIFDIENWLWKSKFCNFWQRLLNWTQDLNIFIELVIGLEHKGRPCKMCDSVQQKLGHTKAARGRSNKSQFPIWRCCFTKANQKEFVVSYLPLSKQVSMFSHHIKKNCVFAYAHCPPIQNSHDKIWMTFAFCNLILLKALTK